MPSHPDVHVEPGSDGSWSVMLGDREVVTGLTREQAEQEATKTPSELVRETRFEDEWFNRGYAAERITDGAARAEDICDPIEYGGYRFDLFDLYDRMWEIGEELADGTRLFRPRSGGREALKWLIADLSGTPADSGKKMPANHGLRQAAHVRLQERGWAERINQVSFRLLRDPNSSEAFVPVDTSRGSEDEGEVIVDVTTEDVTATDRLRLGDFEWSTWHTLDVAAREATIHPGVYVARSGNDLVYVGMAGERRGMGVRGRLQIYARGRGAVSGLGEAALDRALADPVWLRARLDSLHADGPARAKDWARDAIRYADLQVCWTVAPDAQTAKAWEHRILEELEDVALWNRARPNNGRGREHGT